VSFELAEKETAQAVYAWAVLTFQPGQELSHPTELHHTTHPCFCLERFSVEGTVQH
jgi:hypothetical protein